MPKILTAKPVIPTRKIVKAATTLEIKNLHVALADQPEQEIIKGLNLVIKPGQIHIIMGPNGSGKSTLCYALMGHPKYKITNGKILLNGKNITELSPDKRAQLGLFLGFQYPREIPGITMGNFLRIATNALQKAQNSKTKPFGPGHFLPILQKEMDLTKMDHKFMGRGVNEGFSGGEKKRAEILQMAVLQPQIAMLDEIDSGLDIDALKIVAAGIQTVFERSQMGVMLITHYQRILNYLTPHFVHIMVKGEIVKSGDHKLALKLEKHGYKNLIKN